MGEVDPAFIQELEHRPKPKIVKAEGIPVIDLSTTSCPSSEDDRHAHDDLVKEIGDACRNWGFFQVVNHGVPLEIRQKIEDAARKFFGQPLEEKNKVRRDEARGLGYYDSEHTKNVRDWQEVFDFFVQDPTKQLNQWPQYPPELREVCEEYAKEVEKLAYKLLELIALSLGLAKDRFHGFFEDQISAIRLNHYPPCPRPDLALGVGRHKDPNGLTILAQDDVGGLEVKRKIDGEWLWVKPTPNAYIINVGDSMQVWSNDAYESVEHRVVVNSERRRFSIPYFFSPAVHTIIHPLEELTNEQNPAKYRPYEWGEFIAARRRSNFQKLDAENLQIYHFKIPESGQVPQLDNRYTYDDGPNNPPTTILFDPVYLSSRMYQLSPIQDWTLATTLMRPTRTVYEDSSRDLKLTRKNYGSIKRVFIIAEKDLTLEKDFQQWLIQKNPPNEVEEIFGSDHMSMMSKPWELWSHLLAIAGKYD